MSSLSTMVLDLLAPSRCLACRRRAPMPWCSACNSEVRVLPAGCVRCAGVPGGSHLCWPDTAPIDAMTAVFDYRGPVAAAVVTAKVGGARAGWRPLAQRLATAVAIDPPDVDVVTWITTPVRRARRRGLDHAEMLAHAVGDRAGLPVVRLLAATAGADGRDRYRSRTALPGTNVLLVDDVVTTGATAVRAATSLREAGAGRIALAVLARAGSHPLGGAPERRGDHSRRVGRTGVSPARRGVSPARRERR